KGLRTGYYHENEQLEACRTFTKAQLRVEEAQSLIPEIDAALGVASSGRPGPVLLEVPLDVLRQPFSAPVLPPAPTTQPISHAIDTAIAALAAWIKQDWRKPILLAGGGVISAGAERQLAQLAVRLGAPVVHTLMGNAA